jgi:branched-chain amino acid transport system ATP-binding protein
MRPTSGCDSAVAKPLLQVQGIAVQYGGVRALEPTSFSVPENSLTLILGPNGAGKTSLLKAIAGAVRVRTGRVLVDGADVTHVPAFRRVKDGIVLVPEGRGRLPTLSVRDNLVLGWEAAPHQRRGSLDLELARIFELFPILEQRLAQDCASLSGGEMQMLAIGRALLAKPRILLLDEPSLGLAPLATARVYEALSVLSAGGLAMIIVEQKAVPLPSTRETTIVLHNGRVRFHDARRPTIQELATLYLGERSTS